LYLVIGAYGICTLTIVTTTVGECLMKTGQIHRLFVPDIDVQIGVLAVGEMYAYLYTYRLSREGIVAG
jgi:hypothetical protein